MGYESRLYVMNKYKWRIKEGYCANKIAVFDMYRMGYDFVRVFDNAKPLDFTLYSEDGYAEITEDMYGAKLSYVPVADVIRAIEELVDSGETYRRIKPVLQFLRQLQEDKDEWDDLVVIHYEY